MRRERRSRVFVLAVAGILVTAGVSTLRARGAQARPGPERAAGALALAIAEVEAGRTATPLIGEPGADGYSTVTFLAKSADGHAPRIVSDVTGWGERLDGTFDFRTGTMTQVGGTEWYSLDAKVAPRARIEYLIAYGQTDYRPDPHNPRRAGGPQLGGAAASEFVMPGYVPPAEFADAPVSPAGVMTETTVEGPVAGVSCHVIVYTPPGYRDDGNYPAAVFLDLRSGHMSPVLDWLIARQAIEPIVAVFVGPKSRGDDACTGAPMRTFLTLDLPKWMAVRYAVTRTAGKRAIIAISYGAKDALDAALAPGGAYDRLGLLIPGRRIGRADIQAVARQRHHRLQVAILAGQYDRANVPTARSLRQALVDAGHDVDYTEVPEGHSAVTWHNHLRVVLLSLFGERGKS